MLGINPWIILGVGLVAISGWARYGLEAIEHRDTQLAWEEEIRQVNIARQTAQEATLAAAAEAAARAQAEKMAREAEGKVIIKEVRTNATDCESAVPQCIALGLAGLYPENSDRAGQAGSSAPTSLLAPPGAGDGASD